MVVLHWVIGIGFLVLAGFYFIWTVQKKSKYAFWAELGLWVLLVVQFAIGSLSLTDPSSYLGLGILIAFIARLVVILQGRK
jgi:hypothetical protein